MPQVALLLFADHFQIGNSGVQYRVPVDQTFAAIDQAFFMQTDEDLLHCVREAVVHGEAFVTPVEGGAEAAQLAGDVAARFALPLPHPFNEFFPSQVVAALALGGQLPLHHHLRGDSGMVGARLPQGGFAAHALVAHHGVHHRVVEAVPHVQAAGDVGRRDHDAVGIAVIARIAFRGEEAVIFPVLVPALFDIVGVVAFIHGYRQSYVEVAGSGRVYRSLRRRDYLRLG